MKRYAELIGNYKRHRIKSRCDNKLDYRGNITVALHNDSDTIQKVERGDRIAQMMWMPFSQCEFIEVDELSDTKRGEGGFGHTGTK